MVRVVAIANPPPDRTVMSRLRWLLFLGMLELLAVTLWLDTESIAASGLSRLILKKLPDAVILALLAGTMSVLLGGLLEWTSIRREIEQKRITTSFPWGWYATHLVFLAIFATISYLLSHPQLLIGQADERRLMLAIAWPLSALAASVTWLAALLPTALWPTALRTFWKGALIAVPVTLVAWLIGRETRNRWGDVAGTTMNSVIWLLRLFGERPEGPFGGNQLSLSGFSVEIDAHCSGYEGVGAMAVFASVYVWAMRSALRFPQALLLVPLAMAASWCGNVVRIALLMEIGARISPDVARGGFHSHAGWLFLIAVSALVMGIAQRFRFFTTDSRTIRLRDAAAAACLAPFLSWHVLGILAGLVSTDPRADELYPLRFLACVIPLWYWRRLYYWMLRVDKGWLVGAALGTLAFGLWLLLDFWLLPDVDSAEIPAAPWLAFRILGSCLAVPFIEELAFRGYLLRRMQAFRFDDLAFRDVRWPAFLVSSIAFGALHGERWIAGICVGLIYAYAARKTERLSAALIAHAVTNSLLTAYVLTTSDYARWH